AAEIAVMTCLIDCASKAHGYCIPSAEYIAGWVSRPLRTVERAIASLKRKHLVRTVRRGLTSCAYLINWPPLFQAYRRAVSFQKSRKALWTAQKVADHDRQKWRFDTVKSGGQTMEENHGNRTMDLHRSALSAHSYLVDIKKVEEALQGEVVESASTN